MLRLFRVVWTRGTPGDGNGYSAKASLALRPMVLHFARRWWEWEVTLFGVRFHYMRSYGGIIV